MSPCRVCERSSRDEISTIPLCADHLVTVSEVLPDLYTTKASQRMIGLGDRIGPMDDQGTFPLKCDKSSGLIHPHTWSDPDGSVCPFCLEMFVGMLRDARSLALSPIEIDIEDQRYKREIVRRGNQLERALTLGVVTNDEATRTLGKWMSHVE